MLLGLCHRPISVLQGFQAGTRVGEPPLALLGASVCPDLSAGNKLTSEVMENGAVILRKWAPIDFEFARAVESTLSEWGTDEDNEAYRELLWWSVVVVPFPFTVRNAQIRRPALVLCNREGFGAQVDHSVMAMITSAPHSRWPFDVVLTDREASGLPAPSLVRMKLFTLDDRLVLRRLGQLAPPDREAVVPALDRLLGRS